MTIAQIYEEAKRQLDKGIITIGEFSEIVDREYQEPSKWIPVSEELPEIDTYVLCTVAFKYDKPTIIISKYDAEDYWFNEIVTAWMPLPKPYEPKEYKEKEK